MGLNEFSCHDIISYMSEINLYKIVLSNPHEMDNSIFSFPLKLLSK